MKKLSDDIYGFTDNMHEKELAALRSHVAELASFAFYVLDHSNDPALVANAKRVLGK